MVSRSGRQPDQGKEVCEGPLIATYSVFINLLPCSGKKSAPELMMPDFDKKNAQASNKKQNKNPSLLLDDGDEDGGDEDAQADEDLNIFDLFPDPVHFVQFLKQLDRGDIGSALFIRLLEAYRASSKTRSDGESMRYASYLHALRRKMALTA